MLFDIGLDPLGFGSLLFGKDLDFGIGRSDAALKERFLSPRVQLAGIDPVSGLRTAVSDSRSDQGSLAQRVP